MTETVVGPPSTRWELQGVRGHLHNRALIAVSCVVMTVVIGGFDYITGIEARVFPLYYLPIAIAGLTLPRLAVLSMAALSALSWIFAMWAGDSRWGCGLFAFNAATQAASFALVAVLTSDIARKHEAERTHSRRDPLTLLPNSRAFYELAEVLVAGARRSGRPFTIAYIDLDNFKTVNDEQGHLTGDSALKETAEVLRRATRASDVSARLGGDEFAILLPDTDPAGARSVLDRLEETLANAMKQRGWPITASIGATSFLHAPASVEAAIHAADALMYRVKREGKGRVLLETVDASAQASSDSA